MPKATKAYENLENFLESIYEVSFKTNDTFKKKISLIWITIKIMFTFIKKSSMSEYQM